MSLILKQIFNLIKLLHSESGDRSIALGIALGFILGMSPLLSLQAIFVILILLVFRIQIGACIVSSFFFKFMAFLLSPVFDKAGRLVLETESLKPAFTSLYNMPIIPYTKFYNSVVMGAGITSIVLAPIIYFIFKAVIKKYRAGVVSKTNNSKIWKAFKATKIIQWYLKYDEIKK